MCNTVCTVLKYLIFKIINRPREYMYSNTVALYEFDEVFILTPIYYLLVLGVGYSPKKSIDYARKNVKSSGLKRIVQPYRIQRKNTSLKKRYKVVRRPVFANYFTGRRELILLEIKFYRYIYYTRTL